MELYFYSPIRLHGTDRGSVTFHGVQLTIPAPSSTALTSETLFSLIYGNYTTHTHTHTHTHTFLLLFEFREPRQDDSNQQALG